MKKLLVMLLVMTMGMSLLAGCGSNEEPEEVVIVGGEEKEVVKEVEEAAEEVTEEATEEVVEEVVEEAPEPVKLIIWESEGVEKDFTEYAISEFNKLYPHIEVEYQPVAHIDSSAKMELDAPNGGGADVFSAPHDHLGRLVTAGLILENDQLNNDEYLDASLIGGSYDGSLYGYPTAIETYALFFNKDVVDEAPESFDDIFAFADEFNDAAANKYAFVWDVDNAYFSYCFLGGFNADLFGTMADDKMNLGFDSDAGLEALTFFQSLRELYDVNAEDADGAAADSAFKSGSAAYMINGPWAVQGLKDEGINFGITVLPTLPNGQNPKSFSGVRANYVNAFTDHPEEAKLLAAFISSEEMLTKRYEMTSQIPPHKNVSIEDEYSKAILDQAAFAVPMPNIPAMGSYWGPMGTAFANIWNGADVQTEIDAAATAMRETIQ